MINALIMLGVGLMSFVGGLAAALLYARKATPAAASPSPVPAIEATPATLEMHLVLNVLNRVVMALGTNERAQDGVADLADYLRAADELRRRPSQATMVQQVSSYWQLSRWLHGQPSDSLQIDAQLPELPGRALARLCQELTEVIRDLEGSRQADASARVTAEDTNPATRQAVVQLTVAGVPEPVMARLLASPRGWTRKAQQLSRRVDVTLDT